MRGVKGVRGVRDVRGGGVRRELRYSGSDVVFQIVDFWLFLLTLSHSTSIFNLALTSQSPTAVYRGSKKQSLCAQLAVVLHAPPCGSDVSTHDPKLKFF